MKFKVGDKVLLRNVKDNCNPAFSQYEKMSATIRELTDGNMYYIEVEPLNSSHSYSTWTNTNLIKWIWSGRDLELISRSRILRIV